MNRPMPIFRALLWLLISLGIRSPLFAELRLSRIFGDHMILQREKPVHVWGWADARRQVTVRFAGQTVSATADGGGFWRVTLKPMKARGDGRDLAVSCDGERVQIGDVVVGDVWHASGQSNMAMTVAAVARRLPPARQHIESATLPAIRFRRVNEQQSAQPLDDLTESGGWIACSPQTVSRFSAAAFYFARILHAKLGVPIGVIDSSRGGTPIEPYIPRRAFHSHPTLRRELELGDLGDLRGIWQLAGGVRARDANWLPARLFHSRLAPLAHFAVRGVIWYQGESNCGVGEDPREYQHKMRALITGWRTVFDDATLPFYFVQLPGSGARDGWPYLREQQRLSAKLPRCGMVVTIDLLDEDIHPPNKVDVGERLARWALSNEYKIAMAYSGPQFERAELEGGQVTVHFSHVGRGLMVATKRGLAAPKETPNGTLSHFELADKAGQWRIADAEIQGTTVIVRSQGLPRPAAVRYAYAINPKHCNLYNRDGLPASPFCSDPSMLKYVPELPGD